MQIIPANTKIPFMKYRWVAICLSLTMISASLFKFFTTGSEKYGVDFVGGVEAVVSFSNPVDIGKVREKLEQNGIIGAIVQDLHGAKNQFSIRFKGEDNEDFGSMIEAKLADIQNNSVKIEKLDHVGPVIGEQIRIDAFWAIFWSLIGIILYVTVRFEFRFAVGAVVALAHDVIIAAGACIFFGYEISAAILAALLTIVGYSVNDTIIIFDRIRENLIEVFKQKSGKYSLLELMDKSINETLSRTIITNLTVIFVCLALWLLGGGAVEELAFALLVGVIVGTYSTVCVASPIVLELERFSTGKLSKKK